MVQESDSKITFEFIPTCVILNLELFQFLHLHCVGKVDWLLSRVSMRTFRVIFLHIFQLTDNQ